MKSERERFTLWARDYNRTWGDGGSDDESPDDGPIDLSVEHPSEDGSGWACGETRLLYSAWRCAIPPGHVVVKVEDLRGIETTGDGVCYWCPACDTDCTYGKDHAPDCWLAAALKEGESHD